VPLNSQIPFFLKRWKIGGSKKTSLPPSKMPLYIILFSDLMEDGREIQKF
jgi:hypothetical protein